MSGQAVEIFTWDVIQIHQALTYNNFLSLKTIRDIYKRENKKFS